MTEHNIDLSNKSLMCHNIGTIQCDTDHVKIFYRNDDIVTIVPTEDYKRKYENKNPGETVIFNTDYKIDLKEIAGMMCQEFFVTFHLLPEDKIEEYQTDPEESWFHVLYHFINYEVSGLTQ